MKYILILIVVISTSFVEVRKNYYHAACIVISSRNDTDWYVCTSRIIEATTKKEAERKFMNFALSGKYKGFKVMKGTYAISLIKENSILK